MTTDEHLDELIEKAEAADRGPWKRGSGLYKFVYQRYDSQKFIAETDSVQNSRFIAAADPTLVAKMGRLIKAQHKALKVGHRQLSVAVCADSGGCVDPREHAGCKQMAKAITDYNNLFQEGE